ncbi:MAG: di-heme oxidoredictase family protein [Cyanobacteria bacterium P01_F01_bin.53]
MIKNRLWLWGLALLTAWIVVTIPLVGMADSGLEAGLESGLAAQMLANRTELSGGDQATSFKFTRTAFAQPIPNLDRRRRRVFSFGDRLFNTQWVQAPGSVPSLDGLGPLFNRNSCAGCHIRDGRGRPPIPGETRMLSKLIRLSVPGEDPHGGPMPHPVYGGQFQEQGILGVAAEGKTQITWQEETGQFADGTSFSLRRPSYEFTDLGYGPLGDEVLFSPRVSPAVFGLGLLENIPESDILQQADPDDVDGDGISGRPNYAWNEEAQSKTFGRFGWKANEPTLKQQIAGAFNGDIGLTTPLLAASSCSEAQADCQEAATLGDPLDVSAEFLDKITTYLSLLAVPARRNVEGSLEQQGEQLFYQGQCASCHLPKQRTGNASVQAEFNNQVIHPYTDLLLHDMGPALADLRPDFEASGQEWRTPPLWGIGLVGTTNDHTFYLHDGRARNLLEAVLWHGGEAQQAKDFVQQLDVSDREALVAFLSSL